MLAKFDIPYFTPKKHWNSEEADFKKYGYWTIGLVDIFLLKTRYAGLEAPPIRCLKHQKYGQVLIENMERSPIE